MDSELHRPSCRSITEHIERLLISDQRSEHLTDFVIRASRSYATEQAKALEMAEAPGTLVESYGR